MSVVFNVIGLFMFLKEVLLLCKKYKVVLVLDLVNFSVYVNFKDCEY